MTQEYGFDATRFRLGTLCKRGHDWNSTGQSLRRNKHKGACLECERISIAARFNTPEKVARHKEYRRKYLAAERLRLGTTKQRLKLLKQGLTQRGAAPLRRHGGVRRQEAAYRAAIDRAGRCPSVARLVMREQHRYWRNHPEARADHHRKWMRASWWLRYQTDPDLRMYVREKSRRRKAQEMGLIAVAIPPAAIRQRFNGFGNRCAYCGSNGYMELEHVVPISKGGAHDISNIVPACHGCNASKRTRPMEEWYRVQPFFSEIRLRRIQRITGDPSSQQLPLPLALA